MCEVNTAIACFSNYYSATGGADSELGISDEEEGAKEEGSAAGGAGQLFVLLRRIVVKFNIFRYCYQTI